MYGPYERPPFPILVDQPSWNDLFRAMRFSDLFMFGSIYSVGTAIAYLGSRPMGMITQRLVVYHGISHMFFALAAAMLIRVPYARLTGFWDNGMRWSKPEDRLQKFDCTSTFEQATGWHKFKLSGNL